jgi:hypothetical protein
VGGGWVVGGVLVAWWAASLGPKKVGGPCATHCNSVPGRTRGGEQSANQYPVPANFAPAKWGCSVVQGRLMAASLALYFVRFTWKVFRLA